MKAFDLPLTQRELELVQALDALCEGYTIKEVSHVTLCILVMAFRERNLAETDAIESLGEAWDKVIPR